MGTVNLGLTNILRPTHGYPCIKLTAKTFNRNCVIYMLLLIRHHHDVM